MARMRLEYFDGLHSTPKPDTPWGKADTATEHAEGVTFYSTPSHGGFRLTGAAAERVPEEIRANLFAGRDWYEEDCDAAHVVRYLPELFTDEERAHAAQMLRWIAERAS